MCCSRPSVPHDHKLKDLFTDFFATTPPLRLYGVVSGQDESQGTYRESTFCYSYFYREPKALRLNFVPTLVNCMSVVLQWSCGHSVTERVWRDGTEP